MEMPLWLKNDDTTEKQKKGLHIKHMSLRVLAIVGPLSVYGINERMKHDPSLEINYVTVLRYVKALEKAHLIVVRAGEKRNASICELNNRGLIYAFFQHYISSEELLQSLFKRSRLVSILAKYPKLREKIITRLISRILPTFGSIWLWLPTLLLQSEEDELTSNKQGTTEIIEDKNYEVAQEEFFNKLISYLEFDLLSDLIDSVKAEDLTRLIEADELKYLNVRLTEALKDWIILSEEALDHQKKIQKLINILNRPQVSRE